MEIEVDGQRFQMTVRSKYAPQDVAGLSSEAWQAQREEMAESGNLPPSPTHTQVAFHCLAELAIGNSYRIHRAEGYSVHPIEPPLQPVEATIIAVHNGAIQPLYVAEFLGS